MKTLYDKVKSILYESSEDFISELLQIFAPILELGLIIYSNFAIDKYFRYSDLIKKNSELYGLSNEHSKQFLDIFMYKKSFNKLTTNEINSLQLILDNIKNKDKFHDNLLKEKLFLERNKNNYILKTYFTLNNQTIDNEITKINFILERI